MTECAHAWKGTNAYYLHEAAGWRVTYECDRCHCYCKRDVPMSEIYARNIRDPKQALLALYPGNAVAIPKPKPDPAANVASKRWELEPHQQRLYANYQPLLASREMANHLKSLESGEKKASIFKKVTRAEAALVYPKHPSAACGCAACIERGRELDAAMNVYRDEPLRSL